MKIDISFDFRSDSKGKDPDTYSATLRSYHRYLWSKRLPIGEQLELEEAGSNLSYRFNMQTIKFSSDSISNSFIGTKKISHLLETVEYWEFEEFRDRGSTIGGYLIFPSEREGGLKSRLQIHNRIVSILSKLYRRNFRNINCLRDSVEISTEWESPHEHDFLALNLT